MSGSAEKTNSRTSSVNRSRAGMGFSGTASNLRQMRTNPPTRDASALRGSSLSKTRQMDTLGIDKQDSIDEEVMSNRSGRSAREYDRVLSEERPHRLVSRRVSGMRMREEMDKEESKIRLDEEESQDAASDLDRDDILSLSLDGGNSLEKDGEGPPRLKLDETAEAERRSSKAESTLHVEGLETTKGKSIVIDVDTLSPAGQRESPGGAVGEEAVVAGDDTKAEEGEGMNE